MATVHFRVNIPLEPPALTELAEAIIAKHVADGAASPLNLLDMTDMADKTTFAKARHEEAEQMEKDKEKAYETRDLALGINEDQDSFTPGTVNYYVKSVRDVLLGANKGREQNLGDWGYSIDRPKGAIRVVIPRNVPELLSLAKNIKKKHDADGAGSPLNSLNMADFDAKLTTATDQHALGEKLGRDKEKTIQNRDKALGTAKGQLVTTPGTVLFYVTSARDILLGVKKGNEQTLGDWGFTVDTSDTGAPLFVLSGEAVPAINTPVPPLPPGATVTADTLFVISCTNPAGDNVSLFFWFVDAAGNPTAPPPGSPSVNNTDQKKTALLRLGDLTGFNLNSSLMVINYGTVTGKYKIEVF